MLRRSARRFTFPLAAPKRQATVIARPARRFWISSQNGNQFTSITAASCNARRSIIRRRLASALGTHASGVQQEGTPEECLPQRAGAITHPFCFARQLFAVSRQLQNPLHSH